MISQFLSLTLPYALGFTILGLVFLPLVNYVLDPKGLRKFPSPSFAAATTPFWRIFHNLHFNHYAAVDMAHKKLGTHVRIGPNHVSILDPRAPYEVYGHGANMLKEQWYDAAAGAHRNLADARDKSEHQAKRKMLAHAFAAKTVVGLEPVLVDTIGSFMGQLDNFSDAGKEVNIRLLMNYFTIDLFGRILYSERLGCLDRGDDVLQAESPNGHRYMSPFIQPLLDATVVNTCLAFAPSWLTITRPLFKNHPYKKAGTDWENIVHYNTKKRMSADGPLGDLFDRLLKDSKGQDLGLSMGEIMAECQAMMNAGTETTTAAMTNTVYLLYTHPRVLEKLRNELDMAFPGKELPTYEAASKLPYLRACIEESLRTRPASSMGLPRIVPEGGKVIAGQFIQGGVTVSVPTYSLLRDELVFDRADQYDPGRWLINDQEKKRCMMNSHLPFSTGPRACIGRNIAYFEQIVLIATVAKFYDFVIPEGFKLETQERFNSNPGPLIIKVAQRHL